MIRGHVRASLSLTWDKAVADILEWIRAPRYVLKLLRYKALVVDLLKASERLSLLTIEDFLLVHVHYVKMVAAAWKATRCVRLPLYLEEKPVAVAFGIGVRA